MRIAKLFLSGLAALVAISSAAVTAGASSVTTERVFKTQLAASSSGVNVTYRTPDEIRSYVNSHQFSTTDAASYSKSPDLTSPYTDPGALDSATLKNGLNALNSMRYIAGLPEVTLNSDYSERCQYGSYINALNGTISHTPGKPDGVSDSIYDKGAEACGSSNLAMGYGNLARAIVYGYMNDSDSRNIDRLGHRRWCLNPSMKQTGFGQVGSCSSMYAFDNWYAETSFTGVIWPAQNMPVEYFGSDIAWSYSLGTSISDTSKVKVKLTRKSDGKVWNFSEASANGYFNIENSNFGKPGCVIFRPSDIDEYKVGDVFTVHIDGAGTTIDYTVKFFSMDTPTAVTGLSASPSTNSVKLTWNKNSAADSYQVDVYKDGKWVYLTKTTGTSYTATGLAAGTSYKFRVFAFKGSSYSSSVIVTAATSAAASTKPTAVTGLSASPSTNSVKLTWNKNAAADSYQVDVYKDGKWVYLTKTTGTSYTATGLAAGTSYKFRVFAFKGSSYSSSVSVTAATKPTAVTGLSASPSTNSVKLTWNKNAAADSYQVDVYKDGKWVYLTKITGTSYTATGLAAGTSYKFRVFAFKGSSYSSSVIVTAATSAAASTKPTAVTGLSASPSTNSVKLTWNKNSAADSYQVDVYKDGKWVYLTKTTGTSYTATGLAAGTSYKFRVFAFKGSSYSSSVSVAVITA